MRTCTEWQVVAEREFLDADERFSKLTIDSLGRPTIAVLDRLPNSSPTEQLALTVHQWNGSRWAIDILRQFGSTAPHNVLAVPRPNGRTGVLLGDDNRSYVFEGPPWAETSLSLPHAEPLGAAVDSIGDTHLLLRDGGSLVYAIGPLEALDVRWRVPFAIPSAAYVQRFVVSPRGTRFSIKLQANDNRLIVEGEAFSPQGKLPTVRRADDLEWYRYGRFGDDDGVSYDLFDQTPFSELAVVQRGGTGAGAWSWPRHNPFQLSEEERRCAFHTGDESPAGCVLPAATFTFPVVVPVLVPPALRADAGPTVIALGERDPLADKLLFRTAVCSNDRGPEGWHRSVSPRDGQLVVTGLYDEEPRVRSQVMPTVVGRISAHAASVQIDAYGRVHALFSETRVTDQQAANTRVHYVLLGCGQ